MTFISIEINMNGDKWINIFIPTSTFFYSTLHYVHVLLLFGLPTTFFE